MTILEQIVREKKDEVRKLRAQHSYRSFTEFELFGRKIISFSTALLSTRHLSIIAEIKKASPSAGVIRENFDVRELAEIYHEHGADVISIVTDRPFFQGGLDYLSAVAEFRSVPLLRKDFIIDVIQVFESKAYGADAILLISEILSSAQISELTAAASESGLEVLLELHGADQFSKINFAENRMIGINNRNLEDFSVSLDATERIAALLPQETICISESGIDGESAVIRLKQMPVHGILVGEYLMRSDQTGRTLNELKKWCECAD